MKILSGAVLFSAALLYGAAFAAPAKRTKEAGGRRRARSILQGRERTLESVSALGIGGIFEE